MAKWEIKTAADYERAHRAIQERLDRATKGAEGATLRALTDVSLECLGDSVERAPVELGPLRGSGYLNINDASVAKGKDDRSGGYDIVGTPGETAGNKNVAEIGFSEKYAFTQHEHVEFNHPIGGQAKYLESVVVENEDKWAKHLAESAVDSFRKGG